MADDREPSQNRQWAQPLGYSHVIWVVAIDIPKRSTDPLDRTANRDSMKATNLDTLIGNVNFANAPHPNVSTTPIFGGQWVWSLTRGYELLPILVEKRRTPAQSLSGGQQQMVSIGRALLNQPKLLLCDEISLRLAPKVVKEIYEALPAINAAGTAIVLVEQDVSLAKRASQRLYCMLEGRVTSTGKSEEISRNVIGAAYFGATNAVA